MNVEKFKKLGYQIEEVEIDDPHWNTSIWETRFICPDGFKFHISKKKEDIKDGEFIKREREMRAYRYIQDNENEILDQVEKALIKNLKVKKVIINLK